MKKLILPLLITSLTVGLSASLFADKKEAAKSAGWSYSGDTGPEHWAKLSPDYSLCGDGKNQSPINIDPKTTFHSETRGIKFNYGLISPNTIKNTGNFIQVDVGMGTNIKADDTEFVLKHLKVHVPSENTVNGKHFPMEIQFVHESEDKELAYVSMMFIPGKEDRTLNKLLEHFPLEAGQSKRLPANALRNIEMRKKFGNYYRYNGSMTTPPCSEGVRWFVMQQPMSLSKEQHQAFTKALRQDNNRPIQALNARVIID